MARPPPSSGPAPNAVRAALPGVQQPQLAALATTAPAGAEWISEVKFDDYRLLAAVDHGKVRLLTRSGLDWSDRLPAVCGAIAALELSTAMLDGELVALRADGVSSRVYAVGFRLLEMAQGVWSAPDLSTAAAPELRTLRDATGETAYIAVLEGNEVISLGKFEGAHERVSAERAKSGTMLPPMAPSLPTLTAVEV
jgi:hypothetical protein